MRTRSTFAILIALVVGAVGLTGCADGDDRIEATATFDDVADLAEGAPVMMSDITVGSVRSIELDELKTRLAAAKNKEGNR